MASLSSTKRHGRRLTAAAVAATVAVGIGSTGNAGAAAAGSGAGAAAAPGAPKLRDTICLTGCVRLRKAVVGSTIQVSGPNMSAAKSVSFKGAGKRLVAPVAAATLTSAQVAVPTGARSGRVRVKDAYGQKSELGTLSLGIRPKRNLRASGPPRFVDAQVSPNKVLFNGVRSATLSYLIGGSQPADSLRIDVVTSAGQVVQSFFPSGVSPNNTSSVAWNGTGFDGRPVASGWYSFRFTNDDGGLLGRVKASQAPNLGVAVYDAIFPIRGTHSYGDGIGAPRSGHTHQGQDVFAACGTPLVAARGGKVQYSGYQGAAGNYLVIDVAGSGEDHVYMHMQAPSPLVTGARVRTGQLIGNVGDTGNSSGCHLHFELWSAPGWYEGGTFLDPTPSLKAWDKYS